MAPWALARKRNLRIRSRETDGAASGRHSGDSQSIGRGFHDIQQRRPDLCDAAHAPCPSDSWRPSCTARRLKQRAGRLATVSARIEVHGTQPDSLNINCPEAAFLIGVDSVMAACICRRAMVSGEGSWRKRKRVPVRSCFSWADAGCSPKG